MFTILYDGCVIGYSRLEKRDESMGVLFGLFEPTADYHLVASVFQQFTDARCLPIDETNLESFYQARDALGLVLLDEDHHVVPATLAISQTTDIGGAVCFEIEAILSAAR